MKVKSSHLLNTNYTNQINLENYKKQYTESKPFNHIVIDNFLSEYISEAVVK
jgi:hypothetical protein